MNFMEEGKTLTERPEWNSHFIFVILVGVSFKWPSLNFSTLFRYCCRCGFKKILRNLIYLLAILELESWWLSLLISANVYLRARNLWAHSSTSSNFCYGLFHGFIVVHAISWGQIVSFGSWAIINSTFLKLVNLGGYKICLVFV